MIFQSETRAGVSLRTVRGFWEGELRHGFSTRLGGVSRPPFDSLNLGVARGDDPAAVEENFRRFCTALGADAERMVFAKQVHGDCIRTVTGADAGKGLTRERDYEADGLITDLPGLPLVVFSADCIPVLFYDPVRRAVGACHAGWRGTAQGIAAKTALRMGQVYGTRPEDLWCAIGPGISRCCFETGPDVPQAMRVLLGPAADPYLDTHPGERFHVDLKGINRYVLEQAGVPADHIAVSPDCTACHPDTFYSARRMGDRRGSLAALIQMI